jgi:hypothetical protein
MALFTVPKGGMLKGGPTVKSPKVPFFVTFRSLLSHSKVTFNAYPFCRTPKAFDGSPPPEQKKCAVELRSCPLPLGTTLTCCPVKNARAPVKVEHLLLPIGPVVPPTLADSPPPSDLLGETRRPRARCEEKGAALLEIRLLGTTFVVDCQTMSK